MSIQGRTEQGRAGRGRTVGLKQFAQLNLKRTVLYDPFIRRAWLAVITLEESSRGAAEPHNNVALCLTDLGAANAQAAR